MNRIDILDNILPLPPSRCRSCDSGVLGDGDFSRFDPETLTEVARIGVSGDVFAVDSIEVSRLSVVSVGEDAPNSTGYIHVVEAQ